MTAVGRATLEQLCARALGGDRGALSELCRRLEPPLFRLAVRMLGSVSDAEDATQDVMAKVVTHLSQFEGRSSLSTWAHQICARHVMALQAARAQTRVIDERGFSQLLEQGLAYGVAHPEVGPEELLLTDEIRLSCTQAMLQLLSRDERLALVLVELLGFDGAEAAVVAEVSHDAFRQRLARARSRLSAFLRAHCGHANRSAACSCDRQVPAKRSLGLKQATCVLTPLAGGDLRASQDAAAARDEMAAVQTIAAAFHRQGLWEPPAALRARIEAVLPHVL